MFKNGMPLREPLKSLEIYKQKLSEFLYNYKKEVAQVGSRARLGGHQIKADREQIQINVNKSNNPNSSPSSVACEIPPSRPEQGFQEIKSANIDLNCKNCKFDERESPEKVKMQADGTYKEGKFEEALGLYNEACEIWCRQNHSNSSGGDKGSSSPISLYLACKNNAAQCSIRLKRFESVVQNTDDVLAKDPKNAKALFRRGLANLALGQGEKARADLNFSLELDPDNNPLRKDVLRLIDYEKLKALATTNFREKKYKDAGKFFNEAAKAVYNSNEGIADPTRAGFYVVCLSNAAQCSINLSDFRGAISFATSAIAIDSKNTKALYRRGISFLKLNELERAFNDLKSSSALDADNNEVERELKKAATLCLIYKCCVHISTLRRIFEDGSYHETTNSATHFALCSELIDHGADVNYIESSTESSPLIYASLNGLGKVVELLLSKGAKLNHRDLRGFTPFLSAALGGHVELIEFFLSKGGDLEYKSNHGSTPLWIASQEGHVNAVKLLIRKGAIVDSKANDGCSPLRVATQNGHLKVVEFLISQGADVNAIDNAGGTACATTSLIVACDRGFIKIVELLVSKGARVTQTNNGGLSPLRMVIQNRHLKLIEFLISKGASVHDKDNEGLTPLLIATTQGHFDVVELLLSKGASVHDKSKDGLTPLYLASSQGHYEIVKLLISKGASVCDKDNGSSYLPLSGACIGGHYKVVEHLVLKGANIEGKDKVFGNFPLWIASCWGHPQVVELLLSHGASVGSKNNRGATSLYIASHKGCLKSVEKLLLNGANVHERDNDSYSPIMIACDQGRVDCIEELLSNGANVNDECIVGSTFDLAYRKDNAEVVKLLLSRGVDVPEIYFGGARGLQKIVKRWALTMAIVVFLELRVYNRLDDSLLDLQEFLGC